MTVPEFRTIGITNIPEVRPGDNLASLLTKAAQEQNTPLLGDDILVVTQKIVSKAEGNLVKLSDVIPSEFARQFAERHQRDPRQIEVVLRESKRIVKMDRGVLITETHHGFICAGAGVDASNIKEDDTVSTLPKDPDVSARRIQEAIHQTKGIVVPVIITDTFGRPWREGLTEVAIGISGLLPLKDYRGTTDNYGHHLQVTVTAVADELAACAGLVSNKTDNIPAAIIRGYPYENGNGSFRDLLRDPNLDLFR